MTDNVRDGPDDAATGLDADAERLYRLLLSKADASVAHLAAEAGLAAAVVRSRLVELVDGGFATAVADSRYRAVAPDVVLGGRLTAQLDAVRDGYTALRELLELHRAGPEDGGRDDRGRWEQLVGANAIQSRLELLRDSAEECVRTFVTPPMVLPPPDDAAYRELKRRGVRRRLLFDRAVLDNDPQVAYLRQSMERGDEIRFAKRLPIKLLIVDERATVIGEPRPGRVRAIVTGDRLVVRLALALFDQVWPTAIPVGGTGGDIGPDDALLLALLIAGLTDQSIATKLGIGLRTVQRRVRDLMDLAEVDTRIQLGWHAARNGWVS